MAVPKFIHHDVVRVHTGEVGTVAEVHQTGDGYTYGLQLRTDTFKYVTVPESELALVKPANENETGLHLRYIT